MRIGISSKAVLLAAGEQERFGKDKPPKCLHRVDGETLLRRLGRQLDMPIITVIRPDWDGIHTAEVHEVGTAAKVEPGLHIGHSIAAGLEEARDVDRVVVMAADTMIPDRITRMPRGLNWAIFDPWEWITIFVLQPSQETIDDCRDRCENKIEYMWQAKMPVDVIKTGWVNVNTMDDLERAWKLCSE
jgi:CTP:molybdopterin cytidylyltransferase MocA